MHSSDLIGAFPRSSIRGLGDRDFKDEGLLICEPEVTNVALQPHMDQFSVMASDGLWGFVTDQEVVDTVNNVLEEVSMWREACGIEWQGCNNKGPFPLL